jgi:hypothetical protein
MIKDINRFSIAELTRAAEFLESKRKGCCVPVPPKPGFCPPPKPNKRPLSGMETSFVELGEILFNTATLFEDMNTKLLRSAVIHSTFKNLVVRLQFITNTLSPSYIVSSTNKAQRGSSKQSAIIQLYETILDVINNNSVVESGYKLTIISNFFEHYKNDGLSKSILLSKLYSPTFKKNGIPQTEEQARYKFIIDLLIKTANKSTRDGVVESLDLVNVINKSSLLSANAKSNLTSYLGGFLYGYDVFGKDQDVQDNLLSIVKTLKEDLDLLKTKFETTSTMVTVKLDSNLVEDADEAAEYGKFVAIIDYVPLRVEDKNRVKVEVVDRFVDGKYYIYSDVDIDEYICYCTEIDDELDMDYTNENTSYIE